MLGSRPRAQGFRGSVSRSRVVAPIANPRKLEHRLRMLRVLGSPVLPTLYLQGIRIVIFQLSGFYFKGLGHRSVGVVPQQEAKQCDASTIAVFRVLQ